jgi:23S rRNA (pseudouridine1915-N3)-methyltransferase
VKVTIAAIGKAKETSPETKLYCEYAKRSAWKISLKEFDIKHQDTNTRKSKEAEALLGAVASSSKLVALDERGKSTSSREFAQLIAKWQQQGVSSLGFVIGGADGLDEAVRKKADMLLSFGTATWPHMLVRAMLAEQIYRAQTILDNHPYHRD